MVLCIILLSNQQKSNKLKLLGAMAPSFHQINHDFDQITQKISEAQAAYMPIVNEQCAVHIECLKTILKTLIQDPLKFSRWKT